MTFNLPNIQWEYVIEALKSENIIKHLSATDPLQLLSDPHYLIPFILIVAALLFFRFSKTLVFILGCMVFWYACVHQLTKHEEIQLHNIAEFGITSMVVLGTWIYFFFIREG